MSASPPGFLTRNCAVGSQAWGGSMWRIGSRSSAVRSGLSRVRCYAAKRAGRPKERPMEEDAFYVLRKGGMIAIYKTLSECQSQVSSSVGDPAVGVHKGHSLQKDATEYLTSRGIKNPLYCIDAADWKDDLLGPLIACPFQQPDSHALAMEASKVSSPLKRSKTMLEVDGSSETDGFLFDHAEVSTKLPKLDISSCIIEFDGACKGNPGRSGAGVVIRREDGSVISQLREGLGDVTNNVAEYRALILGMKFALKRGFQKILVQGDSKLVCMQVEGLWKVKDRKMIELYKEANELKDQFLSFKICHVLREFNSDADHQANLAACLSCGVMEETVL